MTTFDLMTTPGEIMLWLAIVAAGSLSVVAVRRMCASRWPVAAWYLSLAAATLVVVIAASVLRNLAFAHALPLVQLAVFFGVLVSDAPRQTVASLCRALAAAAGVGAFVAILQANVLAASIALGITGLLAFLSSDSMTRSPVHRSGAEP